MAESFNLLLPLKVVVLKKLYGSKLTLAVGSLLYNYKRFKKKNNCWCPPKGQKGQVHKYHVSYTALQPIQ